MTQPQAFQDIAENLSFLGNGEDGLTYLMELGEALPPLPMEDRVEKNKIHGCQSDAWLISEPFELNGQTAIKYRGASQSKIVQGRIALLLALYSGRPAKEIAETDALQIFDSMGIREHLPLQRTAGLIAMVNRIRGEARALS